MGIDSLVLVSNYRTDESSEVFGRSQAKISNTIVLSTRTTRIDLSIYLSPSPTLVFFTEVQTASWRKNFHKPRIPICPYIRAGHFFLIFFSSLIFFIDRHSRLGG